MRVDAETGKVISKQDWVISCSFENRKINTEHNHDDNSNKIASNNLNKELFQKFTSSFFKNDLLANLNINGGSYKVIPYNFTSPDHSPLVLISNPENQTASPNGWHNAGNIGSTSPLFKYDFTRGNNVWAKDDLNSDNNGGLSPSGGGTSTFNYPYLGTYQLPSQYLNAATTNLFYMNNIMHDVWYQYGFNEANGNFQQNNLGKFATGAADAVQADSQDGNGGPETINNANFSTPPDGSSGRMQMYLWNRSNAVSEPIYINSPSDIAGPRIGRNNAFSPGNIALPVAPALIESNLVLFDDGTPDTGQTDNADACGAAVNASAINGNIAVVRRSLAEAGGGSPCSFTVKVKNAQLAGAVAVIVVNNVAGLLSMSGDDATITIPAVSVTQTVGDALIARIKTGTVNGKIQVSTPPFLFSDGDFDNGIIAHEYGHGISTRLAGGPNNSGCLGNYDAMGEGWSDYFALIMQMKTGDVGSTPIPIGTFAVNQPITGAGIRDYPYSNDILVNPRLYGGTNVPIPSDTADIGYRYVMGEFWCSVLWDLTWAYVQKYGFSSDIYNGNGGNNKVMRLVLDGLKLQPCNPGMITGRDALLAADQATTNGLDYDMIAEVFRRRGLGLNASQGASNNPNDQIENFTPFPLLANKKFDYNNSFEIFPNPTNGLVNIKIDNYFGELNIELIDLNGRIINETKFITNTTLDLNQFQSGIYLLKIKGTEVNIIRKIIKN